jgi:hypothetical protein
VVFVALAGLRTHFNVFPFLTQVYVTPLVFCETPAFVHLPPFDAAEMFPGLTNAITPMHSARATAIFRANFIPKVIELNLDHS